MIGKNDAQEVAASLGQSLPTTESELKEAETVESFAAEEDAAVEATEELLVPQPSSSPDGNGRVLGQHTGGQIISASNDSQSLPAHDYIFVGRAEEMQRGKATPEQIAWIEAKNLEIERASKNPRKNARIIDKYLEELSLYIDSMNAEDQGPDMDALKAGIEAGEENVKLVDGKPNCGCGKSPCVTYGAETCDAEFVEVIESVSNVWSDEADGSETFVVEQDLKDYLIEEFYEETFDGLFVVSEHDTGKDLWEITFPYFMSEDVIDVIAQYQALEGMGERDEELADWIAAEEFNARGFLDSDDLFEESSRGISKSTAAIATAVLALGAAYWWSQRK